MRLFAPLGLLLGLLGATAVPAGEIAWSEDPKGALASARAAGKPVLVDVWAVWCAPCKLMEKTTYRDEKVLAAAAGFVPLKVDADQQKAFAQRYEIGPLPATLFLDGEGREIGRRIGFLEAPELAGLLNSVASGFASFQKALAEDKNPAAWELIGRYYLGAGNPGEAQDYLKKALKASSADPAARASLQLALAEARLENGDAKGAAAAFTALAGADAPPEIRARSLAGLRQAELARGRDKEAQAAQDRLRQEFPGLAPALEK